jgi:hypothetical protein
MDELIGQLAAKAGASDVVAEKNIGIIPGFLRSEGFFHSAEALIYRMARLRHVGHELFRFGHDKIGIDGIAEMAGTPGLNQLG